MSDKVDRFCEQLRVTLTGLENRLDNLKAKIERDRESTKAAIDSRVDEAKAGLGTLRADAEAARARMKAQVEEKKTETKQTIAEWKHDREVTKLQERAEDLEAYASWAVLVAADAIDEADLATLQAIAARLDADYAAAP
jgi:chromosome segregation ATPase